jgi:hypothetical protein
MAKACHAFGNAEIPFLVTVKESFDAENRSPVEP